MSYSEDISGNASLFADAADELVEAPPRTLYVSDVRDGPEGR
jgi:hypothetical protein